MRVIAIANQKGGAGKTTLAVNLAAALGRTHRVLVIDKDPQANLTSWFGVRDGGQGFLDVLIGGRKLVDVVQTTQVPGVDLVPSSTWLRRVEKALFGEPGAEEVFRQKVEELPKDRWDVLITDTTPWLGILTVGALVASHSVVVPLEVGKMALEGLRDLFASTERVQRGLNPSLRVAALVPGRIDERNGFDLELLEKIRRAHPKLATKQVIHQSTYLKEANSHSQPIEQYAPRSRAAKEFRVLATDIMRRSAN